MGDPAQVSAVPQVVPSDSLPVGAERVMFFGGTFDPVHLGHTGAGEMARDQLLGPQGWLVLVPAARSPLKAGLPMASDEDRLAMLGLALRSVPRAAVWTEELKRGGPSYWIDTLRRAAAATGARASLRFVIGADQAVGFRAWREWEEVLRIAQPAVVARPPVRTRAEFIAAMRTGGWAESQAGRWGEWFVEGPAFDISATDVRQRLRAGELGAGSGLDPAVFEYIRARGLYRAGADH
jgi:nicotinate-nucleotide adenylyltransferase